MPDQGVNTCFVISPFGEPFDTYFVHIIKPALEESGLYAVRGDSLYRPTTIMDDIWQGIRESNLLIAELTDRSPNVFYELGLAHALSKPVILISESIDDVPFDLRSIRVLLYDKNHPDWGSRLKTGLIRSIKEVLENPITAIPATFKVAVKANAPEESETLIRLDVLESMVSRLIDSHDETLYSKPSAQSRTVERKPGSTELWPGQMVIHDRFGTGVVIAATPASDGKAERAQINFENVGMKLLDLSIAKVEVISG